MRKITLCLCATAVWLATSADSCSTSDTTSTHQPQYITATEAGSLAHCQKMTGAYMFQAQGLPFTAAYRHGIDGACEAAPPHTSVAVVAQEARDIAEGRSP